jgi:hypothetical protein
MPRHGQAKPTFKECDFIEHQPQCRRLNLVDQIQSVLRLVKEDIAEVRIAKRKLPMSVCGLGNYSISASG